MTDTPAPEPAAAPEHGHGGHDAGGSHVQAYFRVWGALMVFTLLTVIAHYIPLGTFNVVLAMAIAGIKATLVVRIFMHVKYSPPIIGVLALAAFVWLGLLIGITVTDFASQRSVYEPLPWLHERPLDAHTGHAP